MANRLQESIDDLVNKDQTAYVKGRYIGVNARLVLDIFEYCEHFHLEYPLVLSRFCFLPLPMYHCRWTICSRGYLSGSNYI